MKDIIRKETEKDYPQVFKMIREAFQYEPHSDQQEHFLVERLRKSTAFVPEHSLVAEHGGQIVGHILFSKISIKDQQAIHVSLALAPVSVAPAVDKFVASNKPGFGYTSLGV
jgi:predicted N-acetyltransferase YhbS